MLRGITIEDPMINFGDNEEGLSNILETVYGGNAVGHMMTGKAVQRALRGHLLVDKCLHSQLITEVAKDNPEIPTLLDQAEELYSSLLSGEMTLADAAASEVLIKLDSNRDKEIGTCTDIKDQPVVAQLSTNG